MLPAGLPCRLQHKTARRYSANIGEPFCPRSPDSDYPTNRKQHSLFTEIGTSERFRLLFLMHNWYYRTLVFPDATVCGGIFGLVGAGALIHAASGGFLGRGMPRTNRSGCSKNAFRKTLCLAFRHVSASP